MVFPEGRNKEHEQGINLNKAVRIVSKASDQDDIYDLLSDFANSGKSKVCFHEVKSNYQVKSLENNNEGQDIKTGDTSIGNAVILTFNENYHIISDWTPTIDTYGQTQFADLEVVGAVCNNFEILAH
ncbi:MAG: hypothetical protein RCG15_00395 [Candidatus Rickettsia vulgarisii]